MEYLRAVETIREIELKYDVMSIKLQDVSVWPYLRCYLVDMLGYQKARKPSFSNVSFILKNLFRYNPFVICKRMDIWSYSGVITRKKIGIKYHHHASGVLPALYDRILNFENPEASRPHFSKEKIPEKYIISNSWSIFLSRGIEYILRIRNLKISNGEILEKINANYHILFDYKFRIRLLYAQKIATDILLKIGKRPKLAVIECPYDQMGYVWSFHTHSIPVIELQHGVLNDSHYAYNSIYNGGILAPDVLCVYGNQELEFLNSRRTPFCNEIVKTGLYILELSDKFFKDDIFLADRNIYDAIIVIAGQSDCERELLAFIEKTAIISPQYKFIYLPRRICDLKSSIKNISIVFNVNIYQYLKHCDIHCTVSSTTCLEAQYFNKPNIFIELNNTARKYYGDILTEENGSFFISDPISLKAKIDYIIYNNRSFTFKQLFEKETSIKIKKVIDNYLI